MKQGASAVLYEDHVIAGFAIQPSAAGEVAVKLSASWHQIPYSTIIARLSNGC